MSTYVKLQPVWIVERPNAWGWFGAKDRTAHVVMRGGEDWAGVCDRETAECIARRLCSEGLGFMVPAHVDCPQCKGNGEVFIDTECEDTGRQGGYVQRCDTCNGRGSITMGEWLENYA